MAQSRGHPEGWPLPFRDPQSRLALLRSGLIVAAGAAPLTARVTVGVVVAAAGVVPTPTGALTSFDAVSTATTELPGIAVGSPDPFEYHAAAPTTTATHSTNMIAIAAE